MEASDSDAPFCQVADLTAGRRDRYYEMIGMVLLKFGDRGPQIVQLQQALNAKPSRLPRLVTDGIFGAKTKARVVEFQSDCRLKPDGIAGDLTLARLQAGGSRPGSPLDPQAIAREIAAILSPSQQAAFLAEVRPLLQNPNLFGLTLEFSPVVIVLFMIILLMILLVSLNPANRDLGKAWSRQFEKMKEQIKDKPVEVQTAESLKQTKQMAKDLAQRAREQRDSCQSRLDPAKLAKCAKLFKALSDAIQSLLQKITTPTGGGITPENLAKGIAASSQALIQAARALGECTGCDNLFF